MKGWGGGTWGNANNNIMIRGHMYMYDYLKTI